MVHLGGVSLADVVRGTGLSWAMVSRIFSANPAQRRSPSLRSAWTIARYLGIDLDALYRVLEADEAELAEGGESETETGESSEEIGEAANADCPDEGSAR
jgi:transcriptional regulator with XRE-family HTH domain